jgi:hypothetical protein
MDKKLQAVMIENYAIIQTTAFLPGSNPLLAEVKSAAGFPILRTEKSSGEKERSSTGFVFTKRTDYICCHTGSEFFS